MGDKPLIFRQWPETRTTAVHAESQVEPVSCAAFPPYEKSKHAIRIYMRSRVAWLVTSR